MRSTYLFPASLLTAMLALSLGSAANANVVITVDKSTQQMSVTVDGAPRYEWPVSTGRPGYDTPNGTFKPNRMDANHFSQEWDNAPMPHAIFFTNLGHAIHGFFDVKHLGLAVSHGCVRLSPANAATLFSLVKAEGMGQTTVVVDGATPGGDNGPVARVRAPVNETISSEPLPTTPYGQPSPSYYGRPAYGQNYPGSNYYDQSYYRQRYYDQPNDQSDYQQPQYGYQRQPYTRY